MKNRHILLILFLLFAFNNFGLYLYYDNTNPKEEINDLVFEYNTKIYLKDIIESETDELIDTSSLGDKSLETEKYILNYKVVDTKEPLIVGGSTKTVTVGKKTKLVNKFLCGDNHDDTPNCYIEGEYDLNKIGTYNLTYVAIDSSNNKSTKNFKLKVIPESNNNSSTPSQVKRTKISKYIKKYKTDNTMIGIDVSAWQDNIDWKKVKDAGVEFAILRIGFGHTSDGQIKKDNWFDRNIKEAKKYGIDLGIYFYSYAGSEEEARDQAKWIVKTLNKQKLELPIAFDWEDWSDFNSYKVSFKKLTDIAYAFIDEVEKNGYEGMIYGSAYYLKNIWGHFDKTWVAYYTDNNDYSGDYMIWQLTSTGSVNGIIGSVDVNVLYKKK